MNFKEYEKRIKLKKENPNYSKELLDVLCSDAFKKQIKRKSVK